MTAIMIKVSKSLLQIPPLCSNPRWVEPFLSDFKWWPTTRREILNSAGGKASGVLNIESQGVGDHRWPQVLLHPLVKEVTVHFTDWVLLALNWQVTNAAACFSSHLTLDLADAKNFKNEEVIQGEKRDFEHEGWLIIHWLVTIKNQVYGRKSSQ